MKHHLLFAISLLVISLTAQAEERPLVYPFDVTVGGQKAVVQKDNILFVAIEKPVKPDALVVLEKESALFVINAFPCKPDGTVLEGQPAGVIFKNQAKSVKLSETIDKKLLAPGTYLMNVVAFNRTSRVVFTVSAKKGDVKLPDFKKIVEFLRKKK